MDDAPKNPRVPLTDAEKRSVRNWQIALVVFGFVVVGLAFALQAWSANQTTTTVVDKSVHAKTITTTTGAPIPSTLVTTCLGGGVLLLLAGSFYGRITKISWNGIEVDLSAQESSDVRDAAAAAAATAAPSDKDKIEDRAQALALTAKQLLAQGLSTVAAQRYLGVTDSEVAAQSGGTTLARTAVAAALKSVE